jgi:hypothetical protein
MIMAFMALTTILQLDSNEVEQYQEAEILFEDVL